MKQPRESRRQGTVLICVMACMLIASALVASSLQVSLLARRETRRELQMIQTEWLLDAAVQRARDQLRESPDYVGETWRPRVEELCFDVVEATISVSAPDSESMRRIEVVARLGVINQPASQTQKSHQFTSRTLNTTPPTIPSEAEPST